MLSPPNTTTPDNLQHNNDPITKATHPAQPQLQPQPQFNVPSTESIMEQIWFHSKQQH